MPALKYGPVPEGPVDVDTVIAAFPRLRQSLLASFDDCALSALMSLKYENGWSTTPQARGTIFHSYAAMYMRELQRLERQAPGQGPKQLPVPVADQILIDALRQMEDQDGNPVPPEEMVRVPFDQLPELRMAARKFAKDNRWNADKIVDIEKRLEARVSYPRRGGGIVDRIVTGQIDLLMFSPPNGAIVIDYKDTWAKPPTPRERPQEDKFPGTKEIAGLSFHGYFQQRLYAWLVFKNNPGIQSVTLREFYVRFSKSHSATVTRDQLPEIEDEISVLVQAFDEAMMQGAPPYPYGSWPKVDRGTGEFLEGEREWDIGRLGRWQPKPGKHCGFCARARDCPIDEDTRIEKGAPPATLERARKMAAELQVTNVIRGRLIESLKAYVETFGAPIPLRWSKGRLVLGWHDTKNGRRFGAYVPERSDRGTRPAEKDFDREMRAAMEHATQRARAERYAKGARR